MALKSSNLSFQHKIVTEDKIIPPIRDHFYKTLSKHHTSQKCAMGKLGYYRRAYYSIYNRPLSHSSISGKKCSYANGRKYDGMYSR